MFEIKFFKVDATFLLMLDVAAKDGLKVLVVTIA